MTSSGHSGPHPTGFSRWEAVLEGAGLGFLAIEPSAGSLCLTSSGLQDSGAGQLFGARPKGPQRGWTAHSQ